MANKNIVRLIDSYTGENVNYEEVTRWHDGSEMDDSKVDNVIYRKAGNRYYADVDYLSGKAVSVLRFGAKADGVADDLESFKKAFKYKNVRVDRGAYYVSSYIEVSGSQYVYFDDVVLLRSTSSSSAIVANSSDGWKIRGKLTIKGQGKLNGSATGVLIAGCKSFIVDGVTCEDISGKAFAIMSGTNDSLRGEGGSIVNCYAKNCWYGYYAEAGAKAEYNTLMNCFAQGCQYAASISAGNFSIIGGHFCDNENGLYIGGAAGQNNSHGIIIGANVNHNSNYQIEFNQCDQGHSVIGCHFYGSQAECVNLVDSKGVLLDGCIVDGKILNVYSSAPDGYNFIRNSQIEPSTNIVGVGGSEKRLIATNNFRKTEGWAGIDNPSIAFLQAKNSSQKALSAGLNKLHFDNVDDSLNCYVSGDYTVKMQGYYELIISIAISGTDMPDAALAVVRKNGAAVQYCMLKKINDTLIGGVVFIELLLSGDVISVDFTIEVGTDIFLDKTSSLTIIRK